MYMDIPKNIFLCEFVKTWPQGFRCIPTLRPKIWGVFPSWLVQGDNSGTSRTVDGWVVGCRARAVG